MTAVGTAWSRNRVSILGSIPTDCRDHSYSIGIVGVVSFHFKAVGTWRWIVVSCSTDLKHEWSLIFTPHYSLIACTGAIFCTFALIVLHVRWPYFKSNPSLNSAFCYFALWMFRYDIFFGFIYFIVFCFSRVDCDLPGLLGHNTYTGKKNAQNTENVHCNFVRFMCLYIFNLKY